MWAWSAWDLLERAGCMELGADLLEKVVGVIGFVENDSVLGHGITLFEVRASVAGAEDDRDARAHGVDLLDGGGAVDAGHGDVHDEDVDFLVVFLEGGDGFVAVAGLEDGVTRALEDFEREGANGGFVLGEEDSFAGAVASGGAVLRCLGWGWGGG